ncbi:MAG: hypothetical protein RLZZ210_1553 [Pseudomonadota bacterium]
MKNTKTCIGIAVAMSFVLTGCGGGGGGGGESTTTSRSSSTSSTTTDTTTSQAGSTTSSEAVTDSSALLPSNVKEWQKPSNTGTTSPALGLKITEISSTSTSVPWFEIYNPNTEAVSLASHKLKSLAKSSSTNQATGSMIFDLPNIDIPAGGYVTVSPKVSSWLNTDANVAFIEQGGNVPTWGNDGYIELLYNGNTTDMISVGKLYTPTTVFTDNKVVSLSNGKQSVALWQSSWQNMNFATPAAVNDTDPTAVDEDGDGIPTIAKALGKTFGGIDVYAMGARKGQKDVFIQIDYMNNSVSIPQKTALDKVKQSFAKHNIALHIDAGGLYSETFNHDLYNLGQAKLFKSNTCTVLPTFYEKQTDGCNSIFDYKQTMNGMRRSFFHYVLFAKSQVTSGYGPSGMAEYLGKNSLVTLDGWGLKNSTKQEQNLLTNYQAGAFMHEIGHNFGLLHGGNDNIVYKPNYVSVMNYLYQLRGVTTDFVSDMAADRFYNWSGTKNVNLCTLNNSPCNENFVVDYSYGGLATIDENAIVEANNLTGSKNGGYADWNNDGAKNTSTYYKDLNKDSSLTELKDFNDWANLKFNSNYGMMAFKGVNSNGAKSSMFMGEHGVIAEGVVNHNHKH